MANSVQAETGNPYGKLTDFRFGGQKNYVIYFMNSIMVIDRKAIWMEKSQARRALSSAISLEYNRNDAIKAKYKTVGDFRKHLEDNKIIRICKDNEISIKINPPA